MRTARPTSIWRFFGAWSLKFGAFFLCNLFPATPKYIVTHETRIQKKPEAGPKRRWLLGRQARSHALRLQPGNADRQSALDPPHSLGAAPPFSAPRQSRLPVRAPPIDGVVEVCCGVAGLPVVRLHLGSTISFIRVF